jgi:outer membrane cobalamin receptor
MNVRLLTSFLSLLFLSFSTIFLHAATIKGKVADAQTGEPLVGAVVSIGASAQGTVVKLDGTFQINNVPAGAYALEVSYIGYTTGVEKITLADNESKVINFSLSSSAIQLSGVLVTASGKETDERVRSIEKKAEQVMNILSARTIELLPDITVANALQRMSGITIERNNGGEGRYPIIRGMDKRYNTTLVNGIKIPSPDNKNRYVPLDLFPSELLERLEVSKSLTPSMEGDAIGGTINLVLKDAPSTMLVQANVAGGYSTIFNDQPYSKFNSSVINRKSPAEIHGSAYNATYADFTKDNLSYSKLNSPVNSTIGLTLGNRFGKAKKFGVLVAGSYQNIYRGTNSTYFFPNPQPALNNTPVFADIFLRQYSFDNRRLGLHSKLDYAINANNKISLYNMYIKMDEYQSRQTIDSVLAIQRTGPGSGNVSLQSRSVWQEQSIYNSTLRGDHTLSEVFKFNWSGAYSIANNQLPDWAQFSTQHEVKTAADGTVTVTPDLLQPMTRRWVHNSDKDLTGILNFIYNKKMGNTDTEIKVGGLYRHKNRDSYYNEYSLNPDLNTNGTNQVFTDIYAAKYSFKGLDAGTSGEINANTYNSKEDIADAYIQGKFLFSSKLEMLGGVRVENTVQKYQTVLPKEFDGRSGSIKYTDVLPSLQFKYLLGKKQNLRAAYYKAISRPGFFEIIPYRINGEYYDEGGNPYLKHTRSDNFDLRYELFPGAGDQILLGGFYKKLQNPIEYSVIRTGVNGGTQVLVPNNFGTATNYGFEAVVAKFIGNFGVKANYTYTKSRITTDKNFYFRDDKGQISNELRPQTRPLQGQADHIGNFSFIYKNPKSGTDFQIAYVYTGKRIIQVSPYYGLDYWQRPFGQLDFSVEQRITKGFNFYAKVANLTNTPLQVEILQPNTFITGTNKLPLQTDADRILVQKDFYKLSFLVGIRYKL